ncbi:hypothetical protein DYB37_006532 [Aphanomyces astaci]|uniref:glucan endo-1,3-beta-D-glucosidase n=1 Tax=Aphanomyces astaci TaxID=112090 RepID=A0A3R7APH1_APHAT|nr:hypothetical protein DYB35_002594 [Aphanomyces astaci]RHZ12679.1 hypothetical protein DYB37_006532 [Aphanomyces astaci]
MKVPSSLVVATAFAASSVAALDAKFYGINYDTRTSEWGGCKDFHTIAEDFTVLKEVTDYVRIYSMNFDCTKRVLEAADNRGLKVWLGMWSEVGTSDVHDSFPSEMANLKALVEQTQAIRNDNVLGIQVSSEALYRYYVQGLGNTTGSSDRHGIDTIRSHLDEARSYLRGRGFTFPVVITDIMDMYSKFPELYEAVDVVSVNQFSFWQHISPEDGAHFTFTRFQEEQTRAKRAGKLIELHETGWSAAGENPVVTEASPRAQGVFTQDFLTLAARQNLNTFYFSAFDLTFGTSEIERNFGIHYANRAMKPEVKAAHVGAPLQAVRLWAGGNVIKAHRHWNADDSVNEKVGRVYAAKPSVGRSGVLDDEIWLWDAESSILYSKSSNVCLDSYGDLNTQTLHTYYCSKVNRNQKWSVANGNIASQNDANFCIDVDVNRPTTPDGNLVVAMYRCNGHPNQLISMVPAADEPLEIGIKTNGGVLTEWYGKVTWETNRKDNADCHQWFYDPVTQLIASKSHRGMCLDAYERKNDGAVHLYYCNAANINQKWVVNDITGQIHHATHIGFCLDGPDNANGLVHLWSCYKTEANQQWSIKPVKALA